VGYTHATLRLIKYNTSCVGQTHAKVAEACGGPDPRVKYNHEGCVGSTLAHVNY